MSGASERVVHKHPALAGSITGVIEICITFPIEFVKIQLQLQESSSSNRAGHTTRGSLATSYTGPWNCFVDTLRTRGFFGLYRGLSSWLYFGLPRNAARFYFYEIATELLQSDDKAIITPRNSFFAGAISGAGEAALFITPMQTVQIKMAHDQNALKPRLRGFWHTLLTIYREEGLVRGFYAGLWPTIAKTTINQAIRFSVFNELKRMLEERTGAPVGLGASLFAGAFAGGLSAVVTQPIDTVKANMQGYEAEQYNGSAWRCTADVFRRHGVPGLYRGLVPRLTRVCIENALLFTLYHRINLYLNGMPW